MPWLKVRISKEMDNMLHRTATASLSSKSEVTRMLISLGFRASQVLLNTFGEGDTEKFYRKLVEIMEAEGYEAPKK